MQGLIFQKVLTQALHIPQDKLPMHQFPAPTPSRGMRLPVLRHACLVLAQPLPGALPCPALPAESQLLLPVLGTQDFTWIQ